MVRSIYGPPHAPSPPGGLYSNALYVAPPSYARPLAQREQLVIHHYLPSIDPDLHARYRDGLVRNATAKMAKLARKRRRWYYERTFGDLSPIVDVTERLR